MVYTFYLLFLKFLGQGVVHDLFGGFLAGPEGEGQRPRWWTLAKDISREVRESTPVLFKYISNECVQIVRPMRLIEPKILLYLLRKYQENF